jgi:hypothetical protein
VCDVPVLSELYEWEKNKKLTSIQLLHIYKEDLFACLVKKLTNNMSETPSQVSLSRMTLRQDCFLLEPLKLGILSTDFFSAFER